MSDPVAKFWRGKQTAYRLTFNHHMAKGVLDDLRAFCFVNKSPGTVPDERLREIEGRRQVYYRLMDFLNIDYDATHRLEETINDD